MSTKVEGAGLLGARIATGDPSQSLERMQDGEEYHNHRSLGTLQALLDSHRLVG